MPLPTLVLLPGLDGTGVLFRPLIEALSPEVPTVTVRYPNDPSLGYAELLPLALDAVPPDGPFMLLGESFSGPIALRAAVARPERLAGVVLAATFVRNPHPYLPPWVGPLVPSAALRLFPACVRFKMLLSGYGTPQLGALTDEALSLVSARTLASRLRQVLRVDATRELAACRAPILYLQGSRDFVVPASSAKLIHRLRPDTRIESLPAPHMVLQVQPHRAAELIISHLRASPARSRPGPGP